MPYYKKGWMISYTVKDSAGYPVAGYNNKRDAIRGTIAGRYMVRTAARPDGSYAEDTTIFDNRRRCG